MICNVWRLRVYIIELKLKNSRKKNADGEIRFLYPDRSILQRSVFIVRKASSRRAHAIVANKAGKSPRGRACMLALKAIGPEPQERNAV